MKMVTDAFTFEKAKDDSRVDSGDASAETDDVPQRSSTAEVHDRGQRQVAQPAEGIPPPPYTAIVPTAPPETVSDGVEYAVWSQMLEKLLEKQGRPSTSNATTTAPTERPRSQETVSDSVAVAGVVIVCTVALTIYLCTTSWGQMSLLILAVCFVCALLAGFVVCVFAPGWALAAVAGFVGLICTIALAVIDSKNEVNKSRQVAQRQKTK